MDGGCCAFIENGNNRRGYGPWRETNNRYISDIEEDKEEQLAQVESTVVPNNDVATKDSQITIILTVHDDENGEPQVEVNLQKSNPDTSLANLMATYSEESK